MEGPLEVNRGAVGEGHNAVEESCKAVEGCNTVEGRNVVDQACKPVDEGCNPVDDGRASVDDGSDPVDDGSDPVDDSCDPVDDVLADVITSSVTCSPSSATAISSANFSSIPPTLSLPLKFPESLASLV